MKKYDSLVYVKGKCFDFSRRLESSFPFQRNLQIEKQLMQT